MKRLGIRRTLTTAGAVFISLTSGLIACSSEQPRAENQAEASQASRAQNPGYGQNPEAVGEQQAMQQQQPGQQPVGGVGSTGTTAQGAHRQLGIVSETPSTSQIPTEKTVIDRHRLPTVTVTRVGGDINRMTAEDFRALGLPADLAQNVIQYREAHGPFKSVRDLAKVQNMDQDWLNNSQEQLAVASSQAGSMGGASG